MSKPLIPISYRQAIVFACFLVFYEFLTYIANDMIMPGMLQVVHSFNAPESAIPTSLTLYILGGASLQLILGPVSDTFGRRPMMLLGAILFLIFTVFIASSHSIEQFMLARFFQGMGLCFIAVIGYATIQEIFAEMDAIRIIAIMSVAAILAPLLGPLFGAIVIHYTSWRWIFVTIALGAIIALWGLWRYMPEPIGAEKHDGAIIPRAPLSIKSVFTNYKDLFTNPSFVFSALALGLDIIPCMVWIALAPIIMVAEGKITVIEYALWQIPIFSATIIGNWVLHRLTYRMQIKSLVYLGSAILMIALSLTAILPYLFGNDFHYLLPGIIVYFFALSLINAPLNRFCLFITPVTKGTASAIVSLLLMVVGAIGIELGSAAYKGHINAHLGLYCTATGILYLLCIALAFTLCKVKIPEAGA